MHLRDPVVVFGYPRFVKNRETELVKTAVRKTCTSVFAGYLGKFLCVVAVELPLHTVARQTFVDVDCDCRVSVRAARVVDHHGSIWMFDALAVNDFNGRVKIDAAHTDFHIREKFPVDVYFL